MTGRKLALSMAIVFLLLLLSFWVGRLTTKADHNTQSSAGPHPHAEGPEPSAPEGEEAGPHPHAEGSEHGTPEGEAGEVKLSLEERESIGLKTVAAERRRIDRVVHLSGVVRPHPDKEADISSRVSGVIIAVFVKEGDTVQEGQPLAEVQSAEMQRIEVDLIQAQNRLTLAQAELERVQKLVQSKIAARKSLIEAQNNHQAVLNEIEGLTRELVLLGLSEEAVRKVQAEKTISSFPVLSPLSGIVAERNVVLGETVGSDKVIFRILDPSVVYVEGEAFEDALPLLKVGQTSRTRLASYPGEVFAGVVSRLSPVVDPLKRTIHVWTEIQNSSGKLKPNLFAETDVVVGSGGDGVAVPSESLITTEGGNFVFVEEEEGSFHRIEVVPGAADDRYIEVRKGLALGDRVVTDGKQQVYTKWLMSSRGGAALGGHEH